MTCCERAQHTDRFIVANDKMNSDTEAESELSLESRSFLHRVNSMEEVQLIGKNSSLKQISLDSDEEVISLSHAKVYVFSDSVLRFGKMNENAQSYCAWEDRLTWFKSSSEYKA